MTVKGGQPEANQMEISEIQEWLESGKDPRDAAYGLLFKAADMATKTPEESYLIEKHLRFAEVIAQLALTEELIKLRMEYKK